MKKRINGGNIYATLFADLVLIAASIYSLLSENTIDFAIFILSAVLLTVCSAIFEKKSRVSFSEYVKMITEKKEGMSGDAISKFPLPMAVLKINGQISWFNDLFSEMVDSSELYNVVISDIMPELRWSEILKSTGSIYTYASYKGHKYNVVGDIIKSDISTAENPDFTVLLYFIDKTETENLRKRYEDEKTDIAIINIDNYDEIFQKMDDSESQQTMAKINKYIIAWVSESKGVLKKTERDRYLVLFEHRYLKDYIQKKFDILELVRGLGDSVKLPITISIGIGVGGTILENNSYARAAIDMALGRGGDQAAVKDATQYSFFGGIAKDYEKSTRVKTRAFSVALKDFILNSDKIIFMGHAGLDYDSFGAAIGLQRAVRILGKTPYIVMDNSPAVKRLKDEADKIEEYAGLIISTEEAEEIITMNTLLVVLDTHRPSMLPDADLLDKTTKVVLIDHHRRSTDFISNTSLIYHEPYASSTCEMVAEILQYIDIDKKLTPFEAKALYVGILMDTKNFTVKTGVRTFESASYLRRYGLNTAEVRKLFDSDKDDYIKRAKIVENSETVADNILISVCRENYPNMRVISSQAADDMLNINNIAAAFVLYKIDGEINLSARSLGDINVQLIAEKLGGGGHSTVSGAQLKTNDFDEALTALKSAIDEYIKENRKD
ncbi:MAG: DHH family phosphoesterase [Clostridia bacterium]|nr:DHH family phosphoesterase [Clostridia bacterium]